MAQGRGTSQSSSKSSKKTSTSKSSASSKSSSSSAPKSSSPSSSASSQSSTSRSSTGSQSQSSSSQVSTPSSRQTTSSQSTSSVRTSSSPAPTVNKSNTVEVTSFGQKQTLNVITVPAVMTPSLSQKPSEPKTSVGVDFNKAGAELIANQDPNRTLFTDGLFDIRATQATVTPPKPQVVAPKIPDTFTNTVNEISRETSLNSFRNEASDSIQSGQSATKPITIPTSGGSATESTDPNIDSPQNQTLLDKVAGGFIGGSGKGETTPDKTNSDGATEIFDKISKFVKEHPMATALIVGGIVALIVFGGRKRR